MAAVVMTGTIALRGALILDGGRQVSQAWVRHGVLTFEASTGSAADAQLTGWIVPGLVDMHCHLGLGPDGAVDEATTVAQAHTDLAAGTLLVRDAGSPLDTRWLQDRDDVPELIRAGRHLARPKRYIRHYAHELSGVGNLPEAMAEQARLGDGWVKIVGDWIDRERGSESDLEPLWPAGELAAGVAAAHRAGARVTVHTFATEALDDLLAAGVDCLEHGTGMQTAHIAAAAARGIPVVPTLLQIGQFDAIAAQGEAKFPRFASRMRSMYARRYDHVRDLYDAGVPLLLGTDAGGTIAHGRIADEAAELAKAGIPAADILAAASWTAREFLGRPGLAEGAPADLVVYPADPREDIAVLGHPSAVVRRGRIVA